MNLRDRYTLLRLRRGDVAAFEAVVHDCYAGVYRQLWHLCGDPDVAADLTQETFVQAWRSMPSFAGRSSLRTWLYTIALRVWHHHRRLGDKAISVIWDESVLESLPDPGRGPDREALVADDARIVQAAIQRLGPASRDVIVLFYIQSMKYREIADALEIPIGTVKSRLNAAMVQLRTYVSSTALHGDDQ